MRIESGLSQLRNQYKENPKLRKVIGNVPRKNFDDAKPQSVKQQGPSLARKAKQDGVPYAEAVEKLRAELVLKNIMGHLKDN